MQEVADEVVGLYPDTVLERVGDTVIYLRDQADRELFNKVKAYRNRNKDSQTSYYDAMEEFCTLDFDHVDFAHSPPLKPAKSAAMPLSRSCTARARWTMLSSLKSRKII